MAYTDRLKEARKVKGLSQHDLAELLGIGASTVSGYETGIRDPSMATLQDIMKALDIDANYLFQDEMGQSIQLTEDEQELVGEYRSLNDVNKSLSLRVIHYLRDSQDMEVIIRKAKEWKQ